ncbi:Hypothetical protein CINCED_3A003650, partial [Cinara cedri]
EVVRNPDIPDVAINVIEEQAVELDIEEQNPIDIQPKVLNNHESAAIDKNIIEERSMKLNIEEEKCSTSTRKTTGKKNFRNTATSIFHHCNGRIFEFKRESNEENEATIAFINNIVMNGKQ